MEQGKILKTLRLVMLLSGTRYYNINELKTHLDVSVRTMYRYLDDIESAGFILERNNGLYRLQHDKTTQTVNSLLHFTAEDVFIFYEAIAAIDTTGPAKERLLRKLNALYDYSALNKIKDNQSFAKIQTIREAISQKKRIILRQYRSSHSNTVEDRTVEAFGFTPEYRGIICCDSDKTVKQFSIDRIESVIPIDENWKYEDFHRVPVVDSFRMAGENYIGEVIAILNLKAYNLITEQFPLSKKYIQPQGVKYKLQAPITKIDGIARFMLGLLGDVAILGPQNLINHINNLKKLNITAIN